MAEATVGKWGEHGDGQDRFGEKVEHRELVDNRPTDHAQRMSLVQQTGSRGRAEQHGAAHQVLDSILALEWREMLVDHGSSR